MRVFFGKVAERLLNLLPTPIFLGLIAFLLLFGGFWVFRYRPELVPAKVLLDPWFIACTLIIVFLVVAYYVVKKLSGRPKATASDCVSIWLAELEGDTKGSYLRDLKGQLEQELSQDPNLKDVVVSVYPGVIESHSEARRVGTEYNARAVVWGSIGRALDGGRLSNLKLTILGGPMNLETDVQFRSEMDFGGYEMKDVARFVTGYALLSGGMSKEAMVHFDRILDNPKPSLFELADALQFGGIASSLSTQLTNDPRELLEKAKRYFTKYTELWSEEHDPLPRAMGFFNMGTVEYRLHGGSLQDSEEALRLYNEAAKLFGMAEDDEGYAMVQIELAHIFSDLYQIHNEPAFGTGAYIRLEEASRVIKKEEHPQRYARLMFERGRLFTRQGYGLSGIPVYFKKAVEAFEEAIEVYNKLGRYPADTALALLHWGGARVNMENVGDEQREEVLEVYRQAASIATKQGFPGIYAEIKTSVGTVLLDLPATAPNLRAAIEAVEEALAIETPDENAIEYARACRIHAQACLSYVSLQEVSEDESVQHLNAALRSAEGALKVVSPNLYPGYHRHASELAEEAREKLADIGAPD